MNSDCSDVTFTWKVAAACDFLCQ